MRFHSHSRPLRYRSLHLLLVFALLLGQTLALAHDHDSDAGLNHGCALCLFAHHADSVLPGLTTWIQPSGNFVFHPAILHDQFAGSFTPHYEPRAPPHTFL